MNVPLMAAPVRAKALLVVDDNDPLIKNAGAFKEDWQHFDRVLGLTEDLLPVVCRTGVEISPRSHLTSSHVGRVPCIYDQLGRLVGIPDWPKAVSNCKDIERWMRQPDYGICLVTRLVRAFDIDVTDPDLADAIAATIERTLGIKIPTRRREGVAKRVLTVKVEGQLGKRKLPVAGGEVVEFLGTGQMFVAAGRRADGSRYYWDGGLPQAIPTISADQLALVWRTIEREYGVAPSTISKASGEGKADLKLDDPVADYLADKGLVLSEQARGLVLQCPWEDEHTSGDAGDGSTMWMLAGGKGHPVGHFKCMHAHCQGRTRSDYLAAIGYSENVSDDFEVIEDTTDAPSKNAEPRRRIEATPYRWPDPKSIPRRQWLYGRHLIRGFVSVTVAPGGVGKSSLTIAEALAMTSERNLLGSAPADKLNVWLFNLEDPLEEIERRISATTIRYGIKMEDCGNLFVDSGLDTSLVLARQARDGVAIAEPVVDDLVRAIKVRKIDVLIIDPFISCHEVPENDNGAIDRVAKLWAKIAHVTGCAIDLVHHSRKTGGMEVTVEHARGAVALIAAARSARVLNPMTEDEAKKAGVEDPPRLYFNVDNGKANLAPPPDGKFWFKLVSINLGNDETVVKDGQNVKRDADEVGVVTPWRWPDPLDGIVPADILKAQRAVQDAKTPCRADIQASAWAGHVVGEALGIDTTEPAGRAKVKSLLSVWIKTGMFREVEGKDDARRLRRFVEVGEWAST